LNKLSTSEKKLNKLKENLSRGVICSFYSRKASVERKKGEKVDIHSAKKGGGKTLR
jgi:hypothetical protein